MTLPTQYQEYIALSRYARWTPESKRRETWGETVQRYIDFFGDRLIKSHGFGVGEAHSYLDEVEQAITSLDVMPSMRCLMTAGKALDRDNVAGYNCSYVAVDSPRIFDETMYVLMCGTGVGFSVERQYVGLLPTIPDSLHKTDTTIVVADSKIGWASAFRELISLLYAGKIPKWDLSRIRPAGAPLKTFGGRASGPGPLDDLFRFSVQLFSGAAGRKLSSIECHDLMCKIADIVVVGGVRRSALISLSNLTDERMRLAKSGQWWVEDAQRALANNSVCYTEKPDMAIFMKEWGSLYDSKSGERGIFSRPASVRKAASNGRRDSEHEFGTNPCSEIILRPKQFCNLSEVVVRPTDTFDDLKRKVRIATILGTLQSTLTNFRYLSSEWKKNTEEERLLGVSLTGIMDHPVLNGTQQDIKDTTGVLHVGTIRLEHWLEELKNVAIETNKEWADKLGINPSAAITCVKPSGTVSQLVDSASGIHPRYSSFYIRRVRADKKDPLAQMMKDHGVPCEEDVMNNNVYVFSFPMKAPDSAVTRDDVGPFDQLELWKIYAEHWCEHKPSITVYYKDRHFMAMGAWVYKNFDIVSGISFLPHSDHTYKQAPYEEIDEETYEKLKAQEVKLDWSKLSEYEKEDNTVNTKELACTAGACEIV